MIFTHDTETGRSAVASKLTFIPHVFASWDSKFLVNWPDSQEALLLHNCMYRWLLRPKMLVPLPEKSAPVSNDF